MMNAKARCANFSRYGDNMPSEDASITTFVRVASVGAATQALTPPTGAKMVSVYSSVAAILHKTGATAATHGFDIPAGVQSGWFPIENFGTTLTLTAASGNLATVSAAFAV